MRIIDIRERSIRISRYRDPRIPSGGLTTSLVAVVTDVALAGQPVVGYGFASIGRYAQSGLIRERFAPRLLRASPPDITADDGANLDPFRAWTVMMAPRSPAATASGASRSAPSTWPCGTPQPRSPACPCTGSWPAAGRNVTASQVPVYASGGYPYPDNGITALSEEIRHFTDLGFTHAKIKIGGASLDHDLRRIEAAATTWPTAGTSPSTR